MHSTQSSSTAVAYEADGGYDIVTTSILSLNAMNEDNNNNKVDNKNMPHLGDAGLFGTDLLNCKYKGPLYILYVFVWVFEVECGSAGSGEGIGGGLFWYVPPHFAVSIKLGNNNPVKISACHRHSFYLRSTLQFNLFFSHCS